MTKKLNSILCVGMALLILCGTFAMPVSAASYVSAKSAYSELNKFRTKKGVWCWNKDNKTKKRFNTNKKNKLFKLKKNATLEKVAKKRVKEVAKKFSHTRPNGKQWYSIYPKYRLVGENITIAENGKEAIISFEEEENNYNNQKHRRNMLDKRYDSVGIAGYKKGDTTYWVMALGDAK